MTRLADKLGLLVWSEIPVYWDIDWSNPATLANAEQQLKENIARDQNRASIAIWSIANETPVTPARLVFLKKLQRHSPDRHYATDFCREPHGTRSSTASRRPARRIQSFLAERVHRLV
jgi:beta-galactosidase/beta-glucuronidase